MRTRLGVSRPGTVPGNLKGGHVSDLIVILAMNGLVWGLIIALIALGLSIIFGLLDIEMFGFSFWPAAFVGIALATFSAFVTGIFAARLTWHYFAIITIVFSLIFFFAAVGWKDVTGGDGQRRPGARRVYRQRRRRART